MLTGFVALLTLLRTPPVAPLAVAPFEFTKREVVAKVRIDGQGPFTVLLDTGTAPSVIDLKLAKQLGLKLGNGGESGEGGGKDKSTYYESTLPKIGIGDFVATNVAVLVTDLAGLSKKLGKQIQGVMGDSLFSGRVVQFDYPRRLVRFYARSPFDPTRRRKGIQLPFSHTTEVHVHGVRINGQPVAGNLDSGSTGSFTLTPRAIKRLGLADVVAKAKASRGAGFNGSYESRSGKVRSIQIGSIRLSSPEVVFWQAGTGHDNSPWDVNIGNLFLRDYVVTVDYQKNVVTLERP